jgi:hypothetical protein
VVWSGVVHCCLQVKGGFAADLVLVNPNICSRPALLLDYSPEVSVSGTGDTCSCLIGREGAREGAVD